MKRIVLAVVSVLAGVAVGQEERPPVLRQPVPPTGPDQRPRGEDGPWRHQIHFVTSEDGLKRSEERRVGKECRL